MPRKLKILIFNWRDIKNPNSGGAEILTHEIAKRWIEWGNDVSQFSSYFPGAKTEEVIDGVRIIRKGNPDARSFLNSVHFKAYVEYRNRFKGNVDVVLDEIHGLPFFTPFYVKEKKVALICEVAGEIWNTVFPFPFNIMGKIAERAYFTLYRDIPFLTISNSTKEELLKFKVSKKNITVLPMGINVPQILPQSNKENNPTLIFVGRLVKSKGIEDAIEVCSILKKDFPQVKLWIIGRGDSSYESQLMQIVRKLRLEKNVNFFGFVTQGKKFDALRKAHILLNPSIKEGFGLTVPEAGIVGTPAIAYNVEGLRDIITNMKNGVLVDSNPKSMADAARKMLLDKNFYSSLKREALMSSKSYNWDSTAKKALAQM